MDYGVLYQYKDEFHLKSKVERLYWLIWNLRNEFDLAEKVQGYFAFLITSEVQKFNSLRGK